MLVAHGRDGSVLASDAGRGECHACPECGDEVVLKSGRLVTAHFAHSPGAACAYGSGESEVHRAMKTALLGYFAGVELEVSLVPGRRADAVVTASDGAKFVVECQASSISIDEWEARTADYNRAGYAVWWLWHRDRLSDVGGYADERRFPAEMLHAADEADGVAWIWRDGYVYYSALLPPTLRVRHGWPPSAPSTIRGVAPHVGFPAYVEWGTRAELSFAERSTPSGFRLVTWEDLNPFRGGTTTTEWLAWADAHNDLAHRFQPADRIAGGELREEPDGGCNGSFHPVPLAPAPTCPHDDTGWCDACYYGTEEGVPSPAQLVGVRSEDFTFSDEWKDYQPLRAF